MLYDQYCVNPFLRLPRRAQKSCTDDEKVSGDVRIKPNLNKSRIEGGC